MYKKNVTFSLGHESPANRHLNSASNRKNGSAEHNATNTNEWNEENKLIFTFLAKKY